MPRFASWPLAAGSFSLVALATVATPSAALAQDLQPPPPMSPGMSPSPGAPGAPGSPTAPAPMDPNTPGASPGDPNANANAMSADPTRAKLDEAEREDSGRKFEIFYLDSYLGGSYINMAAFSQETLAIEKSSAAGPLVSLGAGFRLLILTLGVRMRYNALSAFNMWQLNLEVGFKIPIGPIDILIGPHGGYSFVGGLADDNRAGSQDTAVSRDAVSVRGFNAGLDFAIDYYVNPYFSIGGGLFADFLYLSRPPADIPADVPADVAAAIQSDPLYQQSGDSAGFQIGGGLRLGLHLGL